MADFTINASMAVLTGILLPTLSPKREGERLAALRALHDAGCRTWVSIEPYPTPNMIEQDLNEILEAVAFTDRIIFGRTNYSKMANAYEGHKHFYNVCATEVITFCQEHGIDYHIKEKTITKE